MQTVIDATMTVTVTETAIGTETGTATGTGTAASVTVTVTGMVAGTTMDGRDTTRTMRTMTLVLREDTKKKKCFYPWNDVSNTLSPSIWSDGGYLCFIPLLSTWGKAKIIKKRPQGSIIARELPSTLTYDGS